ncbi:hypothetical protein GCM10009754_82260 [Amycolatopsis minnesotensis]|uniref:DUF1772 domain-containing protein n=1 Tax=Amycolatopsis minnesotensis TaxID=337894 RepID=A0ABN2SRI2_9PSEU
MCLSLVSSAMLLGLMVVVLTVLRPLWSSLPDSGAARGFQAFLRFATPNPVLVVLNFVPVLGTVAILFLDGSGTRAMAFVGGGVFFVGYFVVTALVNTPMYAKVMAWDPESAPDEVSAQLARFHRVNVIRLAATAASAALFFAAA